VADSEVPVSTDLYTAARLLVIAVISTVLSCKTLVRDTNRLRGLSSQAIGRYVRQLRAMGLIEPAPMIDHERGSSLVDGFYEEAATWRALGV
jgi:DNA-binding MarR family transcriptional regulator